MKNVIEKIIDFFHSVLQSIASILYPKKCMACGRIIDEKEWLCPFCKSEIVFIDAKKRCLKCGHPKTKCECKRHVYHFESLVSVFENADVAKTAFYRYKFARRMQYAIYFSNVMADSVRLEYKNIKFDYVCCVPQTVKSYLRRGFEHSNLLCQELAKILEIPVKYDILGCREGFASQHKSSKKKRAKNVLGKYYTNGKIKGNVLLVDDIVTTGSTLDECAKQLLFAGADKVYCVSVLISDGYGGDSDGSRNRYRFRYFKNRNFFKLKGGS